MSGGALSCSRFESVHKESLLKPTLKAMVRPLYHSDWDFSETTTEPQGDRFEDPDYTNSHSRHQVLTRTRITYRVGCSLVELPLWEGLQK